MIVQARPTITSPIVAATSRLRALVTASVLPLEVIIPMPLMIMIMTAATPVNRATMLAATLIA
jgi:hypothetical protein